MSTSRALHVAVLAALCLVVCGAEQYRRDLCGKMIHREHNGAITSHKLFRKTLYPRRYTCLWRIMAPPKHRIQLFIPIMKIEFDFPCDFDHLDIYDDVNTSNRSRRIAKLCGQERGRYVSSGSHFTLHWISDGSVRKLGFLIRYMFIPEDFFPRGANSIAQTRRYRCISGVRCDGYCIPSNFTCDGYADCENNMDEMNCSTRPTNRPRVTAAAPPATVGVLPTVRSMTCGHPTILPDEDQGRVVGGKVAIPGSWPWTVSLRYNGRHVCGGSIIAPRWVLTATHCVEGYIYPPRYTVVAGLHHKSATGPGTQTIGVRRIVRHPNWVSQTTDYDFTLLYLTNDLNYTDRIGPICLPSKVLGGGVGCFVAGWGETRGTGGAGYLKQAFVKTFSHTECSGFYKFISGRMLCAGHREGGRDTCQGDSGGPLMCKINGTWELHGATSFGGQCGAPNRPGVYAWISVVMAWIKEHTGL